MKLSNIVDKVNINNRRIVQPVVQKLRDSQRWRMDTVHEQIQGGKVS